MFVRNIDLKVLPMCVLTVGLLAGTTALAGCSSSTSTPTNSASSSASATVSQVHNESDVEFAQMMIPHHEQAIVMAQMVPSHSRNADLNRLAKQIEAAQAPEIAEMKSWLAAWGVQESATPGASTSGSAEGHGHGSHSAADGMMTPAQMEQLEESSGMAFDKMWLQMMIEHHEGAIEMSKAELANGTNPQAKALATSIAKSQTVEITQMYKLLGR